MTPCSIYSRTLAPIASALLMIASASSPAQSQSKTVFQSAEFVLSGDVRAPGDSANWMKITLPHRWHDTHPGVTGLGWYRIPFSLERVPQTAQAINISHWRSRFVDFYINGNLIGGSRDVTSAVGGGLGTGVYLTIPPMLLRSGENMLHARMRTTATPINIQGLGRVTYGDARPVRRAAIVDQELGFYAERTFLAMALAAGLITFFVWVARRSDRVMFWFSITCLSWAGAGILFNALRWTDLGILVAMLNTYVSYGLVVPAVVLSLRTVELKLPRLEAAMWIFFALEIASPLRVLFLESAATSSALWLLFHSTNAALLLAGVGTMLVAAKGPLRWPVLVQIAALFAMAVVMLQEPARVLGWVDVDGPVLRPFHVPVMLLAIGAAIYERYVVAVSRMEHVNLELEHRVAQKTREIQAFHIERQNVLRQQTLARERQRILADMHDGLGASLVGLLRYVQSDKVESRALEQRVKEALQELRIAIDALEPSEGNLGTVLGNLRYRLEPLVASTGGGLSWNVAELPLVEELEPSAVFAIQRIVLEAISNAIQHSGAKQIRLEAQARGEGIEIRIEDDGRGFELDRPTSGLGLTNMKTRAQRLGGALEIISRLASGTAVVLALPRRIASAETGLASEAAVIDGDAALARNAT